MGTASTSPECSPRRRTRIPRCRSAKLREGTPSDVSYRIAGGLGIGPGERQRLLETEQTSARLGSVLRLLERENALLKELIVRLRARGEGPALN